MRIQRKGLVPRPRWWNFPAVAAADRPILGYFLGVAGGAMLPWLIVVAIYVYGLATESPELNRTPREQSLAATFVLLCLILMVLWVIAAWFITSLPFLAVRRIAKWLHLRSAFYYVASGAVIGTSFCGLQLVLVRLLFGPDLDPPPFWPNEAAALAAYAGGGAFGAFVFWWIAVRARAASAEGADQ